MRTIVLSAVIACFALLGCSDATSVAPSVNGQWIRHETVPGNFFGMSLTSQGDAISGTGSFQGEAGFGGTSTVTGSVAGTKVNLDFTLVTQFPDGPHTSTEHFSGTLLFGNLAGTMSSGADTSSTQDASVEFERSN